MSLTTATPTALELRRGSTLSSLVAREISTLIVTGHFSGGDRLNEAELATRFGVSRGPVREALRIVEREGLAVGVANRGVFVRQIDERAASNIYELRAALFSMAGWILAQSITTERLDELAAMIDKMQVAEAAGDLETYYNHNLDFHAVLVRATGNERLAEQYAGLIHELHLFRRRSLVLPGRMRRSNAEHRGILDALRRGDRDLAAARMRAHVLVSRERVVGPVRSAD